VVSRLDIDSCMAGWLHAKSLHFRSPE